MCEGKPGAESAKPLGEKIGELWSKMRFKEEKRDKLIYGLYYPAILGVLLVGFFDFISINSVFKFEVAAGLFPLVYFTIQFIEAQDKDDNKHRFLYEALDIFIIYQIGVVLGFASPLYRHAIFDFLSHTSHAFYFFLGLAFALPIARRIFHPCDGVAVREGRSIIAGIAIIACFIGLFVHWDYWILVALTILLLGYFILVLQDS